VTRSFDTGDEICVSYNRGLYWLTEELSASQEGLCSMEIVVWWFSGSRVVQT
jgi:hypothetical protein